MKQVDMFLESEGDAFYARNKDKPRLPDPVIEAIQTCQLKPKAVLEIGCGNGWRLAELDKLYGLQHGCGIEPSREAVKERVYKNVMQGDALKYLPYIKKGFYDTIIFGFCLYLVDREDLMLIAAWADRALKDGGYIIIHDFYPKYTGYRRPYGHKDGVWSYKQEYHNLWLSSPQYKWVCAEATGEDDNRIGVVVLRKLSVDEAWPVREP